MEMQPTAEAVMSTRVTAIKEGADLKEPVHHLKTHGVAVLVDDASRPIGILTLCDVEKVGVTLDQLLKGKEGRAGDLFPKKSPTWVHTVRRDTPLSLVAQKILDKGLATGITVVDPDGIFAGYVFAADLRERMRHSVEQRKDVLRADAERLKLQHPNANVEIDQWLKRSS